MNKINIIDTAQEYKNNKKNIDKAVLNVLKSGVYINGPEVKSFENELSKFLNVRHCISCANGTDALKIALLSLDLKLGDEVIVPSFTFVSTAEVVVLLGLKPIFVDVDPRTFLIDIESIKKNITKKTRAIIPVHLFGQSADMKEIMELSKKNKLWVIEDSAQSLGSHCVFKNEIKNIETKKFTGTIGHIGTTSFYPTKNLNCFGDGGAMFTNNNLIAKKIKLIKNHGQEKKYVYKEVGLNSRLDAIQATILRLNLKTLNQSNFKRRALAEIYNNELKSLDKILLPKYSFGIENHIFHQYTIIVKNSQNRNSLKNYLNENGVSSMVYYPKPLHKEIPYKSYNKTKLINSEVLSKKVISLPIHPLLTKKEIVYVSNLIKNFFSR